VAAKSQDWISSLSPSATKKRCVSAMRDLPQLRDYCAKDAQITQGWPDQMARSATKIPA
jgi:hypothetical protein